MLSENAWNPELNILLKYFCIWNGRPQTACLINSVWVVLAKYSQTVSRKQLDYLQNAIFAIFPGGNGLTSQSGYQRLFRVWKKIRSRYSLCFEYVSFDSYYPNTFLSCRGGGGGGIPLWILGGSVLPSSPNPELISNQKVSFSSPIFRPVH